MASRVTLPSCKGQKNVHILFPHVKTLNKGQTEGLPILTRGGYINFMSTFRKAGRVRPLTIYKSKEREAKVCKSSNLRKNVSCKQKKRQKFPIRKSAKCPSGACDIRIYPQQVMVDCNNALHITGKKDSNPTKKSPTCHLVIRFKKGTNKFNRTSHSKPVCSCGRERKSIMMFRVKTAANIPAPKPPCKVPVQLKKLVNPLCLINDPKYNKCNLKQKW